MIKSTKEQQIYESLIKIVIFFNKPEQDKKLIDTAGIDLTPSAFPVLVSIARLQPTNVGDLSYRLGKDHSSVGRQIKKLELQALISINTSVDDKRMHVISLTNQGVRIISKINQARQKSIQRALSDWQEEEKNSLIIKLEKLVESLDRE
ncbi:MAG: MarR family transcriptional regulator [Lentilactobacillus hilgardii]|uniref:MarR family winged helix-turn-helix transcriptional regulator n=1 Tax=Lactobacillaceae TaxID=33958 RepID=UPI0010B79AF4|nr:hypothetical protein OAL24_01450 [Oenococcus sicerae]